MRIAKLLFGDESAEFSTSLSLHDAIDRLSSVVAKHTALSALRSHEGQRVFGRVLRERVVLTWVTPFVSNIVRPRFVGHFETAGVSVLLSGKFGVVPVAKLWACVFAAVGVLGAITVLSRRGNGVLSAPVSLAMAAGIAVAGFIAIHLSQLLTRSVRRNLADFIRATLPPE